MSVPHTTAVLNAFISIALARAQRSADAILAPPAGWIPYEPIKVHAEAMPCRAW
jgi:hypothetical protein